MARKSVTVGQLTAQNKHLALTCKACNTISTKNLNDVFFRPKMELSMLTHVMHCPECGYSKRVDDKGSLIATAE
jgi:RNase P subunit RPR2